MAARGGAGGWVVLVVEERVEGERLGGEGGLSRRKGLG